MSETQPEAKGVQAQYAAQVAADLERNVQDQERIGSELAALEDQLRALRKDHTLLQHVQRALGTADTIGEALEEAAEPEAEGAGEVPKPRGASAEAEPTRRKKATTDKGETQGKPSPVGVKAARPTLVTLVRQQLTQRSEPRSAAAITAALAEAHPDRSIKATVVRTTVEGLVAKGRARRTKQGSSVFYTNADAAPAEPV
ncbi:hypothetical protein AB0M29_36775 [Streptomyces sp. NPDC051976]|uniref:hypothetical protein n=1 Tax=Streptomyces sp. NPDC051976 TaxID=3154947 RepID=UPI00344A97F2